MSGFDPETLKGVAAECPGFQARATARAVTRYYNACFKPLGLTAEQFSLLVGIGAVEGTTLVDLANSAGVDPTTLSRNLQNLEGQLLVHSKGGRGRLGKQIGLTISGRKLVVDALPLWNLAKAELSSRLGKEKLRSASKLMAELAEAAKTSRI
ncbi:MarR family winged helix-turn-helix transcriptional regulator [Mesorhizobium ciceri]|uniref:MarR family winged helix-turn-helix transcriptional regulator n=1 Tax=Mesorhizobium TaxID=68287 RepID=UPI000483F856|nr:MULTISPECIES: MarR family winged helix-turn-helix transcriptional regulator [Mesorhizobium]AMY01697.1 transcriptional regulator [Mesorhizobium ciceri biovar biserrulae]MBZ9891730.1 MarR family winged helix-turn-helix transcriptional regulator [Mesorhizobium sp. BR1-1-3]